MIIVMKHLASKDEVQKVAAFIKKLELKPVVMEGVERSVIAVIGDERKLSIDSIKVFAGVEKVMPVLKPYKLASREVHPDNTVIDLGNGIKIGNRELAIMAGPCAVENEETVREIAKVVNSLGIKILRGGAFKPRSSPYSFQGLGEEGLKIMRAVADEFDMKVVTEIMDARQAVLVAKYADILQIGSRNMQNFELLKEVGKLAKPVLLKRGLSGTIEEFLMSAEYILSEGNPHVILCERGIRTFETATRNTLDINAVPLLKELTHLPVIVDPSHATGKYSLVTPVSRASVAAGADGLIIEVHTSPENAASDGGQSLKPDRFADLIEQIKPIAQAVNRSLPKSD